PGAAWRLIHENVETTAKVVSLSASDCVATIKRIAELGLTGGVVYDALIAQAAQKTGVGRVLTFNPEDFKRVWPEGAALLSVP
ncbi:MAG: VapC toxin family PIN domain ribonuclease, partial [Candidatus Omnitrophica bacterium]|nr:VapC toxin family PIN domain ribonuclease [Candidatus Omnitrophota bacterium]